MLYELVYTSAMEVLGSKRDI